MMTFVRAFGWIALATVLSIPALASAEGESDKRPWLLATSAHYGTWSTDDLDNSGTQSFAYAQIAYQEKKWGVTVTSKGSDTSYETENADGTFDVTTLTDTAFATYYAISLGGLTLRGGLDFSLPMGKAAYTEDELTQIILDPISDDLMIANVYGEGTNIAPHITVVWQSTEELTLGFGARYTVTGKYDLTEGTSDELLDPGDRFLGVINAAYQIQERRFLTFMFTYSHADSDYQGDEEIYRTGDYMVGEIRYIHSWFAAFNSVLSFSYSTQEENESVSGDILNAELNNSNNNQIEFFLNNIYRHSEWLSLLGLVGYKQVYANDYPEDDSEYDAGRTKYFIEPGIILYLGRLMYVTVKARYSVIDDKADAFAANDATYDIYNVDIGLVLSF